jgi:Spy/CpxP family protein refolding chaperone
MRSYFKPLHTLILAGAISTLAGYSMAQPAPGTGPGAGPAAHGQNMGKHDPAKMQARMTQRLADIKVKLKITPAQEAAWTTYTDAVQPTPRTPMAASHAELSKLPTPERLDRMRALHTEHMAAMTARMDQRAEATKTFYAVLNADQKKVFDEQFSRFAGGHGGHRMGPMGNQHGRHPG